MVYQNVNSDSFSGQFLGFCFIVSYVKDVVCTLLMKNKTDEMI